MERSEPTLIPEWLKSSGNVSGGTTTHQPLSSSLLSDDRVTLKSSRNKSSVSIHDYDKGRPDRTTSSYFRRSSSSNGSAHLRSQGSFGRSNRDRDWERENFDFREKEKLVSSDHKRRGYSDPFDVTLPSRFEKDLRRSQSTVAGKREAWSGKVSFDSSNANKCNSDYSNGPVRVRSPGGSVHKTAFERDFPTLGAEERQGASEIARVSSPGLNTAIQNLPVGIPTRIGSDGWKSALAEVPVLVGSNGTAGPIQQDHSPTAASVASSLLSGLNMAEAVAQGPARPHSTLPQISSETQRLEELAIKQSRQLIPVTPSMPKALALNSSEKLKTKVLHQQQLQPPTSHHSNLSPRSGTAKSDVSKTSNVGKLHVLKPAREKNGTSSTVKDNVSPTSGTRVASSPFAVGPSVVGSAPSKSSSNHPNIASAERKPVLLNLEKRPTAQAQSRSDFFNLVRKKSMSNTSSAVSGSDPAVSTSPLDKSEGIENGSGSLMVRDDSSSVESSNGNGLTEKVNGTISGVDNPSTAAAESNGTHMVFIHNEKDYSPPAARLPSEEEEAAFLRLLGWEENAGEEECLTEEEISSFRKKYIEMRPSPRNFQGMKPKF